jgi:hypothetical protein
MCYNTFNTAIKELTMFVVKRCVKDFDETFRSEVASFETEAEAHAFAEAENNSQSCFDVWFEVEQE